MPTGLPGRPVKVSQVVEGVSGDVVSGLTRLIRTSSEVLGRFGTGAKMNKGQGALSEYAVISVSPGAQSCNTSCSAYKHSF